MVSSFSSNERRVPGGSDEVITSKVLRSPSWLAFVVIAIVSFPHSWHITGFATRVTRRVSHVKRELLTLPEHLYAVYCVVSVAQSLVVFCVVFCRPFLVLYLLAIALSLLLRFIASDYPFCIFKHFLALYNMVRKPVWGKV